MKNSMLPPPISRLSITLRSRLNKSLPLDGNSVTSNNFKNYIIENQINNQGCRNSFKTDPLPPKINPADSLIDDIIIYPNPFSNKITIKGALNAFANYILYDITGKTILQGTSTGSTDLQIDATMLQPGCYLLKLNDTVTGKNIQTNKVVKISE